MAVNEFYLGTFVVYLLIVLGIGAWGYTKTNDVEDFWVYGRDLGPVLATGSYVANFVSAVAVVGFVGGIYDVGYAVMTGIALGLMIGISALYFVVGRIRQLNHVTFPDIIADLTGREWARPVSAIILLGNAWIYLIMQLVGASLLVTTITGVPYEYMVWVVGFVFIAYTVMGGLISVAWTDLVQGSIMVLTVFFALGYMLLHLGGVVAINAHFGSLDPANVAPLGKGAYTALGVVGSIVAFFGTTFTAQSTIIRINATRDIKTAKQHVAASGAILSVFMVALTLLGGATAVALSNAGIALQNGDKAFPVLITRVLPTGVGVVIILAAMSAILSTTDTRLHATGVTTARDIYDYFADDPSAEQKLKVSRYATTFFGVTATAAAVNPPAAIISLYSFRAVLLTSSFLIPVYVALYRRGIDGRAVIASVVTGAIVGVGAQVVGNTPLPPAILGVGVALLSLAIGYVWWTDGSPTTATTVD